MGAFDALFQRGLFTIRRYGPGPKDALGRPTRVVVSETVVDGLLRQVGSIEGEAFVVNEYAATMPLGTDLRPDDEVIARRAVYTVQGSPDERIVPHTRIGVLNSVLKYVGPVTP